MPLKKLTFEPGVNRESTSYAAEGTWYTCDKVRFRSKKPEKIGGWVPLSGNTFLGTARTMWNWATNAGYNIVGIGTSLKYYVENDGTYYDITPLRTTVTLGSNPFASTNGSNVVVVTHTAHGASTGDFVTFSGATAFGGITAPDLNKEFQITYLTANTYSITLSVAATSTASGGGAAVSAAYQVSTGAAAATEYNGWGAGTWGAGGWGQAATTGVTTQLRLWNAHNYGQNLVYGPRGGPIYYWDASNLTANFSNRGVLLSSIGGASNVPLFQNKLMVSDTSRFVIVFGTNEIGSATLDPLFIRWSDQENILEWNPAITNQAGGQRLSSGSKIITAISTKQEIVVFTDSAVYSMQYVGPPYIWGFSQIADNISIMSPQSMAAANNMVYWMGKDKFYMYSGRVETLPCSLRNYVFSDINLDQFDQVICGTNEGFNEIWWFYCSANSTINDRYVVFNHLDRAWYYGTMQRTAWLDSGIRERPMGVKDNKILYHEVGNDDGSVTPAASINAYIESADFDIDDGDRMSFVWRMIPDVTFTNSESGAPTVTVVVKPRDFSGAAYKPEAPEAVIRAVKSPVELYTKQVYLRFRGRQMAFRIESDSIGTAWQLGDPRVDLRTDGRKS
jgi:hypothetical protein